MSNQATSVSAGRRREVWFFVLQRLSAMVLAPLVVVHLGTMIYAIQDGLSAAEILSRTKGSCFWGTLYSAFVVAAAIHASIGLRTIIGEMTSLRVTLCDILALLLGAMILVLGLRAVWAVI